MDISRRWFIGGAASFGAMGAAPMLRAAPGTMSGGKPNLVFGVLSDIHLSIVRTKDGGCHFEGEEMFRKALEWFRDNGVDGVVVCGDMANFGLVDELEAVARAWYAVFPNDKAPDGRRVEKLFVYGNHDWEGYKYGGKAKALFGEKGFDHAIRKDLGAVWRKCFHEDYAPIWRKDVKGYSFVGAHWIADHCRGWDEVGVPQAPAWFAANGATLDPSKPFFYMQHPPLRDTCHCGWVWGHDDGKNTAALSKFRNAVALSGHSHASINDERAIWQGAFTSIGAGSLKYVGLEYGDVGPFGRENDHPMRGQRGEEAYKIMRKLNTHADGHQGMLARVFDDRIVFERRDFEDGTRLGDDWVVPTPAADPSPFSFAKRAAASIAPQFPKGATIKVRMAKGRNRGGKGVPSEEQPVLEVTIPPASRKGCGRALDYALKITDGTGVCDDRYVFAKGFYRSDASGKANVDTVCRLAARRLKSCGAVRIEVRPRNCFGKAGDPISADFRLPRRG